MIKTNKYQTPITKELLDSLNDEVKEWFLEAVNTIPFVRSLISPDRPYAKDLPRDSEGRIIVDLCNPHILEDMDYFIQTRKHYEEHGVYTFLKPNSNPNSEFYKWISEEKRRCLEGYVRPSDGEWVTGDLYFQLNYGLMMINIARGDSSQADRIEGFPDMWEGLYWRYHYLHQARNGGKYNQFKGGNHSVELARRGAGKSYTLASIMAKRLLLGENKVVNKRVVTILAGYLKEFLADKDGTLSKFVPIIDHCAEYTEFPRLRLRDSQSDMIWQMGYKDADLNINKGSLNTVMGIPIKDNVGKVRGKRGWLLFEEFGTFPNLLNVYNIVRPSVEEGDKVFGLIYLLGTAGDSESDFYSAQELMYHPTGYNVYALPNVFDREGQGKKNFSFFFPGYVNRAGNYNKDGVSDVVKSLIEIFNARLKAKYDTSDSNTLLRVIAEIPVTPQDAILKVYNNLFPSADLNERLNQIDNNPRFYDDVYTGELIIKNGKVEFIPNNQVPIRDFPYLGDDRMGCLEVYNLPETDAKGEVPYSRYCIGVDPYENDQSDSSVSLGSIFVLDLFTDNIVAEYTGRPNYADDFYEIVRRLALFYNCRVNYENNKKGMFAYFQKMNSLWLLEDTLDYLKDKHIVKASTFGNSSKGVAATGAVNNYARDRIRDWLMKPILVEEEVDGNIITQNVYNLYNLKGRALIKELINWNNEGNFDRVSALGMLMLYRESYMIKYEGDTKRSVEDSYSYEEDSFFRDNYNTDINNPDSGLMYF